MDHLRLLSGTEQTAKFLKNAIFERRWVGMMPGSEKLATELGINAKTAEGALKLLEREGVLRSQGRRKKRLIVGPKNPEESRMRIGILEFDPDIERQAFLYQAQHVLLESGHRAFFGEKSLTELRFDLDRVIRLVNREKADAWIVDAGSREILEWFACQKFPTFALFGRRGGLPIAGIGPDQPTATRVVARKLFELGHRRIVLLARPSRILPVPGATERAFLEELSAHGIEPSQFNLPVWNETAEGLRVCIDAMMRFTPPTAIITSEPPFYFAVQQHLLQSGMKIPDDVSLVCSDADSNFRWLRPSVAHVSWSSQPWVNRIGHWADKISRGKTDRSQSHSKATFIPGDSVGRAPARS